MEAGTNPAAQSAPANESFAVYLAKQFIYKKGYKSIAVEEAAALVDECDIMLTNVNGMSLEMICIIDADSHPGKRFTMDAFAVLAIGAACQKYSGTIHSRKLPATIKIIEVGSNVDNAAERERLATYGDIGSSMAVQTSGWIVDPARKEVWSSAPLGGKFIGKPFIAGLLRRVREDEGAMRSAASVAVSPAGFPFLTWGLLALLIVVFGLELAFGVGPIQGLLEPSIKTLVAMGGSSRTLIGQSGEWYRLCSAVFLHGGAFHLLMNGIALVMVGYVLESMVGRLWFAALFFVGGLGGSLMSLAVNSPNIVSIGASGAIMGLFAAAFACSFRLPPEAGKTMIQMRLLQVLIPSLLPLMSAMGGAKVDYGAHFGGAIAGALCGYGLLKSWPVDSIHPKFRGLAIALTAAGALAAAGAAAMVNVHYPTYALSKKLMPDEVQPATNAEAEQQSASLVAQYPDDPRTHLYRAIALVKTQDLAGAERELRTGLSKTEILKTQFTPALGYRMQTMLAIVVAEQGKQTEAKQMAAPLCGAPLENGMRAMLAQAQLCN